MPIRGVDLLLEQTRGPGSQYVLAVGLQTKAYHSIPVED